MDTTDGGLITVICSSNEQHYNNESHRKTTPNINNKVAPEESNTTSKGWYI